MTENMTLSRRAAVAGATATAIAAAVPSIGTAIAAPSCPAEDAELVALVHEWFEVGQQLAQAEQQLEGLEISARPPGKIGDRWLSREELVEYWDKELRTWGHDHREAPKMRRWRADALRRFDAWHAELKENRQANGAADLEPKVDALQIRHDEITDRVFALPAQTAAGALAKLRIFAAEDALGDDRPPWAAEHLQAALADLERLAVDMGRAA